MLESQDNPTMDHTEQELREVRRRLGLLFKGDQAMVEDYLQFHGTVINIKSIQSVRDKFLEMSMSPEMAEQNSGKQTGLESPLFSTLVDCPSCRQWSLEAQDLRAKSLVVHNDPFLAPIYMATPGFQPINYLTVAVTVCTRCLFASPDRKDFIVYNKTKRETEPSQIPAFALSELQDAMAERLSLREESGIGDELFMVPRTIDAAILSYKLADLRAKVEAANKVKFSLYKRGSYWTRIALMMRQSGKDDTVALEQSIRHFKEAFLRTDFPSPSVEYQTCFILFSLLLKTGKLKDARDYIAVMEQTRKQLEAKADPTSLANLNALRKWIDAAKNRWEDRESPHIWTTPGLEVAPT